MKIFPQIMIYFIHILFGLILYKKLYYHAKNLYIFGKGVIILTAGRRVINFLLHF